MHPRMYMGDPLTPPYQYPQMGYPPPFPSDLAVKAAAAHAESSQYGFPPASGYHPAAAAGLGHYPGFPYNLEDLAAASRLSVYTSFGKGKNGRAKGE